MKPFSKALLLCIFSFLVTSLCAVPRIWKDTKGHSIKAEFVRISGDKVFLKRTSDGRGIQVNISLLSAADQEFLKTRSSGSKVLKIAEATRRIDAAVGEGLSKHGLKYNEALNDHLFVRRVYSDLAGRIPTFEELTAFLRSGDPGKRHTLIGKLLKSEDYVSHNFNYLADLLRIQTKIPGTALRTDAFISWLKEQIRKNRSFDDLVEEMIMAQGRIWDNPAVGYHMRDNGMKLDHVSFMTKIFLGSDISCAQCHDDPFQDWTQYEYYELSAFLGDLETKKSLAPPRKRGKKPTGPRFELNRNALYQYLAKKNNLDLETEEGKLKVRRLSGRINRGYREIRGANELHVFTSKNKPLKLPDDYQYDDAKPGQVIKPRVIFGQESGGQVPSSARKRLATWLVSEQNPRFAANIANRTWARFFGRGVAEPLHNFLFEEAYNPKLFTTLQEVMTDLDFDIRAFTRAIVGTKAYNTLSTRTSVGGADPYYFPGPILRRMSSEQIWDSLLTLMVKDPNKYRAGPGQQYNKIINLIATGPQDVEPLLARINQYQKYRPVSDLKDSEGKPYQAAAGKGKGSGNDMEMMMMRQANRSKTVLARASELTQPAGQGHFLGKFGQSERNFVIGATSVEGSVPQVMELMNGPATMVLSQPNSLLFQKMKNRAEPIQRANVVFLSILNRYMLPEERQILVKELESDGPKAFANLIWALLNTPEFIFIK